MNIFKYKYQIKGKDGDWEATVISENKQKGVDFIIRWLKGATIKVNSMTSIGPVHGIDNEIIDKIMVNNGKLKKYQDKISNQERELEQLRHDNDELLKRMDEIQRNPPGPSSRDLKEALQASKQKVYVCVECGHESNTPQGVKIHHNKMHKEKREE